MKEVKLKATSNTGKLLKEIYESSLLQKDIEKEIKIYKEKLLETCKEKEIEKIIVDDEEEQLLTANYIITNSKSFDDKMIKKVLTDKQISKVYRKETKTIEVETPNYERLLILLEDGEITEEQYNSMYKNKSTEYVKVQRVDRKDEK